MITVYTTKTCAYCPMVKRYLEAKKVDYEAVDVTDDHVLRDEVIKKSGFSTVPITTDGKSYVAGWKPAELSKMISQVA